MAITTAEEILKVPGPEVSGAVFEERPAATFWVGQVATKGEVLLPEYYDALTRFRGETYVELGYISEDQLDELGRDIDEDDSRSINFAVIRKEPSIGSSEPAIARVEGSGRLIFKEGPGEPLPIETLFPEVFKDEPLPPNSVEVSRFISRDPDMLTKHMISLAVIRTLTYASIEAGVSADYCVIEKPLLKLLRGIGIPLKVLGEPKDIPEQGGVLYPVLINPYQVLESVRRDKTGIIDLKSFFKDSREGLGHYSENLSGEDVA